MEVTFMKEASLAKPEKGDPWPPTKPRVAVLFRRFGPYHHARLNAAGKLLDISGLEACGVDDTYAWEKVKGAGAFDRITLTERQLEDRAWKRELRQQIWGALDRIRPQVVAIPGWSFTDALSALAWCAHTGTPTLVMSESTESDEPRTRWKEWIKRRLVGMCSAALAGGTSHANYLTVLGMKRERVFLGYDAVDNNYFSRKAEEVRSTECAVRSKHGLPERYFLASARFVEKKNLQRLIGAYARYRELVEGPRSSVRGLSPTSRGPWSLVLLGDGPLRPALELQLTNSGLNGHVRLPGFKQYTELPVYYGLASAFVHASTTEQWGLVVNEAMASGLPVLVSNRCGCARDLVSEGENGFTFDPYDVGQLAGLMFSLSHGCDPALGLPPMTSGSPGHEPRCSNLNLAAMGQASRKIAADWGPEQFAAGMKNAVEAALKNPRPTANLVDRWLLRLLVFK
jgi:glycosyltransferase involved in cell wall biosynthesis